jgi:hypothetical protein
VAFADTAQTSDWCTRVALENQVAQGLGALSARAREYLTIEQGLPVFGEGKLTLAAHLYVGLHAWASILKGG